MERKHPKMEDFQTETAMEQISNERDSQYYVEHFEELTPEIIDSLPGFFNNFHSKLLRKDSYLNTEDKRTIGERFPDFRTKNNYSEKYLNGNDNDFGNNIAKAMEESGFNFMEFSQLCDQIRALGMEVDKIFELEVLDEQALDEINNRRKFLGRKRDHAMLPVYKKLREQGYRHYPDLTV